MTSTNPVAFNRGSDDRIAGLSLSACPYDATLQDNECTSWRRGWRNANRWWADDVGGRWPVRELPEVAEGSMTHGR